MATVAMSGSDTTIVNNRVLRDLADGECVLLEFPNDIAQVKIGKNGNAIYGLNETGKMAEITLRVIRASSDDKFLQNLLTQQQANFAGFPLMNGEFIKQVGDGQANVSNDTYITGGGVFSKSIPAKSNVEGDTEQSVSIYKIKYASAARVIT